MNNGTLVAVVNPIDAGEARVVAEHGQLWVIESLDREGDDDDGDLWNARSLVDGFRHCWFDSEMEVAGDE